jgi:hypothetical protein
MVEKAIASRLHGWTVSLLFAVFLTISYLVSFGTRGSHYDEEDASRLLWHPIDHGFLPLMGGDSDYVQYGHLECCFIILSASRPFDDDGGKRRTTY